MPTHNPGDTSRKPSGSSSHSGGHSPSNSPTNAHAQRIIAPNAGNVFGVAMATSTGLKGLNSGWQVWGSAGPTSKRNTSISSVTSVPELSTHTDATYLNNPGDGWSSRPNSESWDDAVTSSQQKDLPHTETHGSLSPQHVRQPHVPGPVFPAARVDEQHQFTSQGYDVRDSNVPRYPATSPTRPTGSSNAPYVAQASGIPRMFGYDVPQTPSVVETDLPLAFRGMAVEDNHQASRRPIPIPPSMPSHGLTPHRAHTLHPPRTPFNIYPPTEYAQFYNNPGRESYIDHPYIYDVYRAGPDPSLYVAPRGVSGASPSTNYTGILPLHVHQQQPIFFDYGRSGRPAASQFYYSPHQPLIYPPPSHSPTLPPQLSHANPTAFPDTKLELQYHVSQHMAPSHLVYNHIPSTLHTRSYPASPDYGSQLSFLHPPSAIYGHNPRMGTMYPQRTLFGQHEAVDTLRSPLLDEFRANKSRKWELREIFGFIVEFSGDQHGSRFIQQKLETANSEEKQIVFQEIVPRNALQLIQDVFGNYVIQKLFEHGTQVQKMQLANVMEGHILQLSLQMYGCRVVQKAVEHVLPEQQSSIVRELEPHVMRCVKDANGNHVIQKLIERVASERLTFVNIFRGNVYELASHPYACRVLQRCLEHLPDGQTRPLLDELHKYAMNLMQDQFGNYVIQFILEQGKPRDRALVLSKLQGQLLQMARHKFASNVCEKALITADAESRRVLIDEIVTPKQDNVNPVVTMMKDQFANYVLQRALATVEGEQKEQLFAQVRPQLANMRRYSSAFSKHLLSIERLLEKHAPA